jgi:3',5'-cyclic AMP phosphodiesterase CpdA
VHDLQLPDDETPPRFAGIDLPGDIFSAAARPHEGELCVLVDQAVRTINRVHGQAKLDFLLLGGDNVDNAQDNEMDWFLSLMDGGTGVKCDSGNADDPVPGPGNDGKDSFDAVGLRMPWYWVTGNHDILNNGNAPLDSNLDGKVEDSVLAAYLGTNSSSGTRVYEHGGRVETGTVIADPKRKPLLRVDLMKKIAAKTGGPGPAGHGVGAPQIASGKANYTFDAGDKVRVIVWDSATETGSQFGIIRRGDLDAFLVPALDKAKSEGRYALVVSHHALDQINDGGGEFGVKQADAVDPAEFQRVLASYPNLIASVVGHTHTNRIAWREGAGRGFWEIMTSALADYPQQVRVIEVFEEAEGFVTLRLTNVDLDMDGASAAVKRGRAFAVLDWACGWNAGSGGGNLEDRNVELTVKVK